MANTFKFGNGNWASKKEAVLAYNDENSNFKPLPFTFDRASSATVVNKQGLIETVGTDEPRIDFSNDSKGALLLEPSRSNYILKSDDVLSTYESQSGNVSDASEPINGFNNSIQIEYDASNSLVYKRDFTPTIGTEYTISCFIQMNDNSEPIHTVDANSGDFSLINNNTFASASDIKTERLGSTNVYRVSATRTATSTNNRFGIIKYGTQSSKGFKVTGFQAEAGYLTSYIPTQGSAVTRSAETCNNAGNSNVFNDSEGVLYAEFAALTEGGTSRRISISDGTANNRIVIENDEQSGRYRFFISGGVTTIELTNKTGVTEKNYNKIAVSWNGANSKVYFNGEKTIPEKTDTPTISGLSVLQLQNSQATGSNLEGKVKDVRVYNTALTDAELIALTS